MPDIMQGAGLRFMALGDSYTIGEGVLPAERWPVQLSVALRERGFKIDEPLIIAKTGWTTSELAAGLAAAQPRGIFDLVSLLIGVNNQYRGLDIEEYRKELRSLLTQAIHFTNGQSRRVLVLSIPDWSVTPFAEGRQREQIVAEIGAFNRVKQDEAQQAGALFLDVTTITRQAVQDPGLLAADGLHPSGKMYSIWAQLALDIWYERP